MTPAQIAHHTTVPMSIRKKTMPILNQSTFTHSLKFALYISFVIIIISFSSFFASGFDDE